MAETLKYLAGDHKTCSLAMSKGATSSDEITAFDCLLFLTSFVKRLHFKQCQPSHHVVVDVLVVGKPTSAVRSEMPAKGHMQVDRHILSTHRPLLSAHQSPRPIDAYCHLDGESNEAEAYCDRTGGN